MVTPNTILNGTYGLDQYFFPRLFGPFLAPGGKARIEAEARAAIGDPMWMAWEAQEATVAAELAKAGQGDGDLLQHVRPGREKEMQVALDNMAGPEELAGDMKRWLQEDAGHSALSDDEDPDTSGVTAGYDADASQLPTQLPNSSIPMPSPSFNAPSPSLHGPADVTADVPRPPAAPQRPEAEPKTMVAQTQTEVPRVVMSDHLAQRLLARLRHKGHHLKMGQISAMEAWRRVRIKYPDVALHAEESLAEAYGVQAPEWVAAATGEVSVSACEGASKGASPTQERPGPALEQPEYVQFPVAGDEALTPSQHGAASAHNDFTQDSPPLAQEAANDDEQVLDTLESPLEMLGSSHSKYADSDTFDNAPILPPDPHDFVVAYRVILAKLRAGLVLPTMDDTSNDSIWRLPTLSQGQGLLGKHAHAITECLRRDITRSRNILHRADERTSDSSSQEMDEMAVSDAAMRLAALVLQCPEVSDAFDGE